jgi:hypothetical protein
MTRESGDRTTRGETSRTMAGAGVRLPRYSMNRKMIQVALLVSAPMAALSTLAAGCGDDELFRESDASTFEAGAVPEAGPTTTTPDGGDASALPSTCGDSTGAPQRLLLTVNNGATSELAAFNIGDRKVDGRFAYPGFLGTTSALGSFPFVVEQANDTIAQMNAQRPWEPLSTWNVAGDDKADGGAASAQPVGIVVPTCTKGYVLRFNRNKLAVLDTTKAADGGAPESYVDLSSLLQPEDTDGMIDMTSAVYVPSKKRIYVVVGSYDRTTVAAPDYALICKNTTASIVAIDETTGQLVSLGGSAPGGGIALEGYNPVVGTPLVYDAARDRLLVVQGGCNLDAGGGAAGALTKRGVEEVDLATGKARTILALNDKGFPGSFVFMDGNRAALTFFFPNQAFFWNPTEPALGPEIPGSLDYASHDGKGNVIGGLRTTVDGGPGVVVVSVPFAGDGGAVDASSMQRLGDNPFSTTGGYLGGAEVWPRP